MKAFGFIALILAMGISAWLVMMQLNAGKNSPVTTDAHSIAAAENAAKRAVAADNLDNVRRLVRDFQAQNGRLPASLDELRTSGLIDKVPDGLTYNAETGEVAAAP
jgi:hypothetical protein